MKNIPFQVDLILCTQNKEVDLLSQLTQEELEQLPQEVLVETVSQSSFEKPTPIKNVQSEPSWMDPFKYLDQGELLSDKNEAKKISAKTGNYLYKDGVLFKRGKSTP